MKAKITRYLIPLLILTIIITFCSFSCSTPGPGDQTIEVPAEETTEEITVEEPEEKPAEEAADEPEEALDESEEEEIVEEAITETTTAETTVNNDMELFRNAIEDYEMLSKGLDYATEVYNIAFDEKLTDEGFGNRYMDLANKVGEDYFGFPLFKDSMLEKAGIKNPTPEMKRILDLIDQWSDKTETIYSYTAKYYYGEGGEFKIKADELQNEADKIRDEYVKLYSELYNKK